MDRSYTIVANCKIQRSSPPPARSSLHCKLASASYTAGQLNHLQYRLMGDAGSYT